MNGGSDQPTVRLDSKAPDARAVDGQPLGPYLLGQELGRGGMGRVYRAFDPRLGRNVALKVLAPEAADDPAFRDRFFRESRILASLDHPNIVPIYDAGEADGRLYIAMRYVEGSDLYAVLKREGPLSVARTIELLQPVARALDAAHVRGVIHRDVKPENILLSTAGDIYLSDFGIAKQSSLLAGGTMTAAFLGTPGYVAPEQIEGTAVTPATDVYAFGCLVYRCLAGALPFPRESEAAVLVAHLQASPPRLTASRPDLPETLDAVVTRALAKRPAERFGSCLALVAALAAADSARSRSAPPAPVAVRTAAKHRPRRASRRRLPAIAGFVAAALAAAAVFLVLPGRDSAPTPSIEPTGQPPVISEGRGIVTFNVGESACSTTRNCLIFVLDSVEDPDGDPVTLESVGPSAGGNSVAVATYEGRPVAHWVAAPRFTGRTDSFDFTVSDGNGNLASGRCNVENVPVSP